MRASSVSIFEELESIFNYLANVCVCHTELGFFNLSNIFQFEIEIEVVPGKKRQLQDIEDCGKRPNIPDERRNNECLWDCKWRENPFYIDGRSYMFIDEGPDATSIETLITTPKIPEDLSCIR